LSLVRRVRAKYEEVEEENHRLRTFNAQLIVKIHRYQDWIRKLEATDAENRRIQLELINKLKIAWDRIDMLNGMIIDEDEEEDPSSPTTH